MKVGIVGTRGVPARYGGFETCAEELALGLTARGHRVYVACRRSLYPDLRPGKERDGRAAKCAPFNDNINLFFPPSLPGKATDTFSHTFFGIFYLLFRRPVDAVLVFNVANSPLVLLLRLLGKKVVLNTDGLEWKRRKWGRFARAYFRFCELVACLSGAVLVSDSRAIAAYYRRKYGRKTVFIPYGARVKDGFALKTEERPSSQRDGRAARDAPRDDILGEYGLEPEGYVLTAGRLEPENNADLIVRAFRQVETDKVLVVVGGANRESAYSRRLKELAGPRVRFLGGVYRPGHLERLLEGCYFYVHGHEVGGTNPVLLRAMAAGCCVLALDVVFNVETVGEAGLFFAGNAGALAEKMRYLLAGPEVVRYYRQAAPSRIKEFYTWEKVVDGYEGLLR